MSNIVIQVAGIQPPQPGKQKGAIIDQTGKKWWAWPEMLAKAVPNQSYEITRYDTNQYMGKTFFTIKDMVPAGAMPQGGNYSPSVQSGPSDYRAPAPRPVGMEDGARRLDIFVCGAFNNIMANPNTDPRSLQMMDMIDILHKLRSAWLGVFGPSPLPRQRPQQDPISSGLPGSIDDDSGNFR